MSAPAAGPVADLLRLDRQICFPLYAATNLLQRLYRPLLAPLGLTYSQYLVMLLLWERAPLPVGVVRDCLCLDIGTISPLLKRMERAGLVARRRDAADTRRVLISLTPAGEALKAAASHVPASLFHQVGFDPDRAEDLRGLTTALVSRLQAALSTEAEGGSAPQEISHEHDL